MDKIGEIAYKNKKSREWVEKNLDYLKKHPYDLLQPSDPRFNDVWGKSQKKQRDRIERSKRNAESEYQERKNFKKKIYV